MEDILESNQRSINNDVYTIDHQNSKILLFSDHAVIWLLRADIVDSGIQYSVEQLKKIKLTHPVADVFFEDAKIGEIYSVIYKTSNNCVNAFFTTDFDFSQLEPFIVVIPEISSNRIECAVCERWFYPADDPCACILNSPVVFLENIFINSVKFVDSRHNNIVTENEVKQKLIKSFFVNSFTNIQDTGEI